VTPTCNDVVLPSVVVTEAGRLALVAAEVDNPVLIAVEVDNTVLVAVEMENMLLEVETGNVLVEEVVLVLVEVTRFGNDAFRIR